MTVIAFSGNKGVGKDTCAAVLIDRLHFEQMAFADAVKNHCASIFALSPEQLHGDLKDVVDARYRKSPRELLQLFGTDFVRNMVDNEFWLKVMKARVRAASGPVVITDCRFQNEVDMVKEAGGVVIYIQRGTSAEQVHESEQTHTLKNIDHVIHNTFASAQELQEHVWGSLIKWKLLPYQQTPAAECSPEC